MRRSFVGLGALALLGSATVASAQTSPSDRTLDALVAGWKATSLCRGLFSDARLTEARILADDLARAPAEYRPLLARFEARVDLEARTVTVPYADGAPPRVTAWRPYLGCIEAPIGAGPQDIARLPRVEITAPPTKTTAWPTGDEGAVRRLPPKTQARVAALVAAAFDHRTYGEGSETTAVVVVKNGRIVAERYREDFGPDTPQMTWSVAKSIAAALVGVASGKGLLKVDDPAPFPEWRNPGDPRARVTVADLMHMNSGLDGEPKGRRGDYAYFGQTTVAEKVAAASVEAPPRTRFAYSGADSSFLGRSLRRAIGDDRAYLAFPFTELFWKIGMRHTTVEADWQGDFIFASRAWTTARDLARFGLLHLNDGVWEGERILPQGWVRFIITPAPAQPDRAGDRPGYGAQWWLPGGIGGLPADAYTAAGNKGQFVVVVPSERLVVVRRGYDGLDGPDAKFDSSRFAGDLVAALKAVR